MATTDTIFANACENRFSCVDNEHDLLVIIAQLIDEIQEGAAASAASSAPIPPGVVDPEGVVTAIPGQTYFNSANSTFWVKASGTGNTGWVWLV